MKPSLTLITLLIAALALSALDYDPPRVLDVEICDNGVDDDGDGAIDLIDPDCDCPPPAPVSFIPNPSFEDQSCCPGNNSQMYCASTWLQGSIPTTDFLHTCGWMGWPDFPPPLPFPDGEGCIGFRDGRPGTSGNGPQPNWKEYAGACLPTPLEIGEIYRIEFHVGFAHPRHSPPISVAFYGASFCASIPFDEADAQYGCPANDVTRGWVELAKVQVSGANSWQKAAVEFSPSRRIEALVIGPDCVRNPSQTPLYYFLDNLVLAEREAFDFDLRVSGRPCAGDAIIEAPGQDSVRYQWYKDGIAMVGETGRQLRGALEEGSYRVRLSGPKGCSVTDPYTFRIPVRRAFLEATICEGEGYTFGDRRLTEAGVYRDTLIAAGGCDSIAELRLSVTDALIDTVYAKIFDGETWTTGGRPFDQPGEYTLDLQSSDNCDSLVYLILERYEVYIPNAFSPNNDGVNDFFTIYGGADLSEVTTLRIFDRWGARVFTAEDFLPGDQTGGWDGEFGGRPAPAGVYVYQAQIVFEDGRTRLVSGAVTLVR